MPPMLRRRFMPAAVAALVAGLATDPAATLAQGAASNGETLFRARCGACHSLDPAQNRMGPHLAGLAERAAGTVEGARYSAALRDSGAVWTAETLDPFLANPRQAIPGTTMTVGLTNASQRAAIIAFLLSPERR